MAWAFLTPCQDPPGLSSVQLSEKPVSYTQPSVGTQLEGATEGTGLWGTAVGAWEEAAPGGAGESSVGGWGQVWLAWWAAVPGAGLAAQQGFCQASCQGLRTPLLVGHVSQAEQGTTRSLL